MHTSTWRRKRPYPVTPSSASAIRTERDDWAGLQPQTRVVVQEGTKTSYEAVVDILTDDLTVVWVLPIALTGRRAFHHKDDVNITVVSHERTRRKGNQAETAP
jgi:nucleoid-associated protein YgaU